ncbi:hypothetical protein DAETH_38710 (plasmid) [Deinococcus aetherius]|uniref:DUF1772 domain-containing protein n=1 Tax=Deinococcus aetherius TaxID=200252 RepID=A0ABN6RKN4_9DEIO|nr:hypothetical protein [Deinococcus aetherius]BDP43902.1 hypothetical protein DAETH_38710 [Deinococcus aetherius]
MGHLSRGGEAAQPGSPAGAEVWRAYLGPWTAWNTVRAVGCLLSTAAFALASLRLG